MLDGERLIRDDRYQEAMDRIQEARVILKEIQNEGRD